VALDLRV